MNSRTGYLLVCFTCGFLPLYAGGPVYDITTYGAVGDEKTVNTAAIQKAIDECSNNGGGTVVVPAGKFISGTILIKDGVTLNLDDNAFLLGSADITHYYMVDSFRTGNNALLGNCFVGAVDVENVGITGKGTIDGRGKLVHANGGTGSKRPFLVRFVRCKNIKVSGVRLLNSTAWTCIFFACDGLTIDGLYINSRGLGNNDGIGLDCTQNVKITNCDIDTGDDGLVFKTTWSKMATKNIEVSNMRITSNHAGIKTGTESMAPFENIKISNVYIYDTNNGGIKLNTVDGAHMRNIEISDIVMDNVRTPMLFRLGSRLNVFRRGTDTKQETGSMENIVVRNVKAKAAAKAQLDPPSGILITGVPGHYIKNLTLENIEIALVGGGNDKHARWQVPEAVDSYPEIRTFGPTIPAYGVWARHVEGLELKNISFALDTAELRPAYIIQDGKDIEISGGKLPSGRGESAIRLENVNGAHISGINVSGDYKSMVRIEGAESREIRIKKNKAKGVKKLYELSPEAKTEGTVISPHIKE